MNNRFLKRYGQPLGIIFFCILLSIPIILPYFHSGFFLTHDGEWALVRLGDMFRSLRDHQFPVRYSGNLNFEYGYPLFNFAYPFPYYFGVLFHFLRFNFVDSIKFLFGMTVPTSLFFMFLYSKSVWKSNWAGVVSTLLYAFLPYRFVDLYVRGSLGESFAFVLFPAILFFLHRVFEKKSGVIGAGVSLAILIMSHNIMSVLFLPILLLTMVLYYLRNKQLLWKLLSVPIFGFALSAFFWMPALFEKNLILLSKIPIADRALYFIKPFALLIPMWGYGTPTDKNPFTYQIGFPQIILFFFLTVLTVSSLIQKKKKSGTRLILAGSYILLTVVLSLFFFSPSAIFWKVIPLLKEINYPWTLLLPVSFLMSFLAGGIVLFGKKAAILAIVISIFSLYFVSYAHPQYYVNRGDGFYLTNEATTTSSSEYTPLWVKQLPFNRPAKKVEIIKGEGTLVINLVKSNQIQFLGYMQRDSVVRINTIYYPGWEVTDNGRKLKPNDNNEHGVMDMKLTQGRHDIRAVFTETLSRLFGDMLSIGGVVGLIIYIWKKRINTA